MLQFSRKRLAAGALLATLALAIPVAATAKSSAPASSAASCQLSVFSWWTGGGEAAGLTKLISIWNKTQKTCPFKNETVAGGAGTNAKAVLAQRLSAKNPPDSFQGHAGKELLDYIKAGQVEPIDFIYKQFGFNKIMPKQLISQITYQGHLYSVPVNIHRANVLWYNPGRPQERRDHDRAEDVAAVHLRAEEGQGGRGHPALARRAVDAEAPVRDRS